MERRPVVKDTRIAEIAWLAVIALLIAAGATPLLRYLARNHFTGSLVFGALIVAMVVAIRRAYDPASATARADVTKYVAYCIAAVLALVTVDWNPHWAIRACITAAEVAVTFDIVTIAARPRSTEQKARN